MHIPNNENKGYAGKHYGKHSGRVRKTLGTNSREQWQKGGLLEIGGEEVSGKGFGWFWGDHRSRCPEPVVYRLQVLVRERA